MPRKVISEFVIPKCTGKAFRVKKSQALRVIEHEGKQVASLMFFNAHNYKEQCSASVSSKGLKEMEGMEDIGRKLNSKTPYENAMLTITDDKVGTHSGGFHCSRIMMDIWKAPGHRSCSDNFTDALAEFGLELEDVYSPSVFNAFANTRIDSKGDGTITISPPLAEKDDYIEFLAEMDVLAVVSACPDDISAMNDYSCKAIKIQLLE